MNDLHLTILSPESKIFDGEVRSVTFPGTVGLFTVLPQHAPIVSSLREGALVYVSKDGGEHSLDIKGGFVELSNGVISACVD